MPSAPWPRTMTAMTANRNATPTGPRAQQLERQIADRLAALQHELGPGVSGDRVATIGRYHADRLLANATITDFIPQLVYRATKEDLLRRDGTAKALPRAA